LNEGLIWRVLWLSGQINFIEGVISGQNNLFGEVLQTNLGIFSDCVEDYHSFWGIFSDCVEDYHSKMLVFEYSRPI
jgi:hypothetical protein